MIRGRVWGKKVAVRVITAETRVPQVGYVFIDTITLKKKSGGLLVSSELTDANCGVKERLDSLTRKRTQPLSRLTTNPKRVVLALQLQRNGYG